MNEKDIKNPVNITFRGQGPFRVDRQQLVKNMRKENEFASKAGVRPGEQIVVKSPLPVERISADELAAAKTILTSPGITIISKRKF